MDPERSTEKHPTAGRAARQRVKVLRRMDVDFMPAR
jgi:hypothetical protein